MHATPPDQYPTDIIDRSDSGGTGYLPEVRPVVPCPWHGHQAAWRCARRIALVLAYVTLGIWAWGLVEAGRALGNWW